MLFSKGEYVYFKKYIGRIFAVFPANKTYLVTLYGYRGHAEIGKQIPENQLYSYEQIKIEGLN
jgi:hypothetical protein